MALAWVFLTIGCNTAAQLLLRYTVRGSDDLNFLQPGILLSGVLYLIGFLSWTQALRLVPVSWAYPLTSLSIVVVVGAGVMILGEEFSSIQLLFVGLIVLGVAGLAFAKI